MATLQYVVNVLDSASGTFAKIALSADDLNKQIDELAHKAATAKIGLDGDEKAKVSVDDLILKLTRLKEKVADPDVNVKGLDSAHWGVERLSLSLDKLGTKDVTAHVKVDTGTGLLSKLGLAGGAGGAGALGSFASPASGAIGPVLGNPYVLIGGVTAALATLPLAATAAAGGIVTILGGALAGLGVYAAMGSKGVKKALSELGKDASTQLHAIAKPFDDVVKHILQTADSVLPKIMKPVGDALNSMAKPLQVFGDTLIKSFASPSVARSIRDLGSAFGAVLKALTPMLPSIINQIADGIDGIAQAIKAHPQIFADMINFLGHLVGWSLQAIGALTRVASWMLTFTVNVGHWLHVAWDAFAGFFTSLHNDALATESLLATVWNTIWRNTVTRIQNGVADSNRAIAVLGRDVAAVWNTIRSGAVTAWNTIWNNTVARVQRGITDVIGWFRGMPGRVVNALTGLGHSLGSFAAAALNEMWSGFKRIGSSIVSWFANFGKSIISVVKKVLGVFSPSSVFFEIGVNLMQGLKKGVEHGVGAAQAAAAAAAHAVGNVGAGVQRWAPLVRQALKMEGLSPGLLGNVLYQMQTESGGNPNATNLTDMNAAMGDPSRGLMQTIMSTFLAYHWPGTSGNIFDPLANIAAALNYARHVYGPSLMSGGMGIGSGHGYDRGGWLMPGVTMAVNATGAPELVVPNSGPGSMAEVAALLRQQNHLLAQAPAQTGIAFGRALSGAASQASARGHHSVRRPVA